MTSIFQHVCSLYSLIFRCVGNVQVLLEAHKSTANPFFFYLGVGVTKWQLPSYNGQKGHCPCHLVYVCVSICVCRFCSLISDWVNTCCNLLKGGPGSVFASDTGWPSGSGWLLPLWCHRLVWTVYSSRCHRWKWPSVFVLVKGWFLVTCSVVY